MAHYTNEADHDRPESADNIRTEIIDWPEVLIIDHISAKHNPDDHAHVYSTSM